MHYQNDTFLFLLQEVSLKYHKSNMKYHKSSMKYHKNSLLTIFYDIAQKPPKTLHSMPEVTGNRCPIHGLSMPITWALSAHQMGIDRPTNGLTSKRYQQ